MRSRNWTVLAVMGVVATVVIGTQTSEAQRSVSSRAIDLSAVDPAAGASGSVLVFASNPAQPFSGIDYRVHRLGTLNRSLSPGEQGDDIYAVYLKVGDAMFRRLQSFNTDIVAGNHNSGIFLLGLTQAEEQALFSEPLVVEVRHDELVVLKGEVPAT